MLSSGGHGAPAVMSTQEMFRRPLFDIAADPRSPERKLASAQGIFLQVAEKQGWRRLESWKDEDHPVLINPKGQLFVGTRRSVDGGVTFHDVVAWDEILSQVVAVTHRPLEKVRVVSLKWQEPSTLRITVDVDKRLQVEVRTEVPN